MKILSIISIALLLAANVFAQTPEKMSYQAVVRDGNNTLVTSSPVGMQISVLQGSINGTVVYSETQNPTTNANGLASLEIGGGTVVTGDFTTIDWNNGPYFIKTETDPTGGTNYTITGTSQLLSVPYALHAKTAESITGSITESDPVFGASVASGITSGDTSNWNNHFSGDYNDLTNTPTIPTNVSTFTNDAGYLTGYTETDPVFGASVASGITGTDTSNWNNKQDQLVAGANISIVGNNISAAGVPSNDFYLGQDTLGGIVFYLYIGSDGNQHGLIVNKNEVMEQWQNTSSVTNASRSWDGVYNTSLMTNSPAASYVNGLSDGGFTDWYLPSIDEMSLLWHNRFHVNIGLSAGSYAPISNIAHYWSSTEYNSLNAFTFIFVRGYCYSGTKTDLYNIRAIRAF